MAYNNSIYVSDIGGMPKGPHWVIIGYETQQHEGDELSRTHPGHGYPAHTTNHCTYKAFLKKEDWEAEVRELTNRKYRSETLHSDVRNPCRGYHHREHQP